MSATIGHTAAGRDTPAESAGRRRSDPWKVAFVVLLIVAVLTVVTWVLLGSRLLVVRDVEVSGTSRLDPERVAAAVDVATGTPLARVDTDAARLRAEDLRLVESAEVGRGWPATLRVEVVERTPVLAMRAGDGFRLIDGDGVRIADTDKRPDNYPLISVSGEPEGSPAVAAAASVLARVPAAVGGRIDSVDAADRSAIELSLESGATVSWGTAERAERKSTVLTVLLNEHPPGPDRHYDVSAPDMAVVE
ncbi:cell division protein FtsQ/DivIB [Streptomonospora wellingtoniae]|uniref:FtsQ-type POTRA domain-containing protein n=1 Tax=Streptomonospora wellingtoniae TaxID=3075544 RepID=A0ABU2KPF3_9ACTN|nr:FtsQ-type POTRA domain-containing protein [Streptomonospora sp. DSM 45055]MDT0301155.1 FtsQ-type POTRA domain-containing protein [Streptomonospora sp. DSM 45055]